MKQKKHPSPVPPYVTAFVAIVYALTLPLYRWYHLLIFAGVLFAVFKIVSKLFPGTVEEIPTVKPVETIMPEATPSTGNPEVDKLLQEGETAVAEMLMLRESIPNPAVKEKITELANVTNLIFKDAAQDPGDVSQIRQFATYFLPTTMKLLYTYDRMGSSGVEGENISGTMNKIEDVLSNVVTAYKKQLDSLFQNQALDIETDIVVMENLLKAQGLSASEF